jgi:PAS domain S-box-containing protein
MLLVDAETLRIVDANPSLLRTLGYTLEEILPLDLSRVFTDQSDNSEALLRKLRDPNPRLPFQVSQRHKDGALLNVEIRGHRLDLASGQILAFTTDDITVRRKVEVCRIAISSRPICRPRSKRRAIPPPSWRCCSWTSIGSSTSTTRVGTKPATSC